MGEFSITHLLLLAVIFLIFFGPSRLPQLGQSLGKAIRGFKTGLSEIDVDAKDVHDNPKSEQISQNKSQSMNSQKVETPETEKKS
ncbi:MAG: twin-arginine translocase TatA/TatE family subunit [Bdellovibrionaceae bacterium]|nr:twin-arginine translocase TatA/TatE family subunit [Pseudobdellovibrionaceae bacterium]